MVPCPQTTAAALAWAEQDFLHVAQQLRRASIDVPACGPAGRRVRSLARRLLMTLDSIDADITEAIRSTPADADVPF